MATVMTWDDPTKRIYHTGLDMQALFVRDANGNYPTGVPWYGLKSVSETPSGAEPTDLYSGNRKYLTMRSTEQFGFTLEAYATPPEWIACDGGVETIPGVIVPQQNRHVFGVAYRTQVGSDAGGSQIGYELTLIYGATTKPAETPRASINESPDAVVFSYECTTTPPPAPPGLHSASRLIFKSLGMTPAQWAALINTIYGDDTQNPVVEPSLPLPADIVAIVAAA